MAQNYGEVDLNDPDIRAEHEALGKQKTMKLQEGRNVLRVMPPLVGETRPFKVFWVHGVGEGASFRSFQCPEKTLGMPCAACEKVSELYRSGNEHDREVANRIRAKREAYCNVVDVAHPEKGVQVLRVAEGTYRDLLGFMVGDERTGEPGVNYTHPVKGMSVIITREGTGRNTKYKCELSRAGAKPLQDMGWLDKMHDLKDFVRAMPADQVVNLLNGRAPQAERQLEAGGGVGNVADDPDLNS